ncbi:unnamed protein product [Protopolystoma xenopodis]|uniref:Amine oxidase domain-containing protein n=1 Tax=Protopolystoma xenopodis TaxID=117903 RepID=A0A3S4ZMD2_9PLAT|nr:unnamed protein product [Protopolystoma xenopodis]
MIASKECFKSDFMKDSELKPDKVLDCGLDQALAAYDWNPSSPIDFAVDAFAADICCGASSHNISKIAEFASSSIYADDDYEVDNFIADGDGYVRILNYLATKAKVLSSANTLNEEIVHMNTVVNKIIWGDSSTGHFSTVHAYNQNKTLTYKAHYVIVTIPSSLYADKLEANDAYSSSVKFEPALPSELQQVLKCIRYSNYIRVFLAYTEAFWDPSDTILKVIDDILMEAGDNSNVNSCWFGNGDHPSRAFFCFQNPLPALKLTGQELKNPQLPVIICHISGDFADRLLDVSDEGLVRMVSESLASIYPNKAEIAKHPVESKVVSWAKEIYSKGAFAYARPGLKFSDLNKLTQKLTCSSKHGGLYLAGDAFTFEYLGCSQGAYLTGFKAAKSIIAEMN